LGIVTDRDLTLQVVAENRDASNTKVQDVMTSEPFTCRGDDDLQIALDAMEKHQVRRIPVIDEDRRLIGMISQADIAVRSDEREKTAEVVEEISRSHAV
jgi:CBS domain-containing protein